MLPVVSGEGAQPVRGEELAGSNSVSNIRRDRSRPDAPEQSRRFPASPAQKPGVASCPRSSQPLASQAVGEPLVSTCELGRCTSSSTTAVASSGIMPTIERTLTGTPPSGATSRS